MKVGKITPSLLPAFASIKPKVKYATLYRRLLYCSHEKLVLIARDMGIAYSQNDYAQFNCDVCHASKAKALVSRNKVILV